MAVIKVKIGEIKIVKAMKNLRDDTRGDSLAVEAAILFPFLILIFFALVILAIYLPTRATLQRSTQYAATVIATEISDTWLSFDNNGKRSGDKTNLDNVYVSLFKSFWESGDDAKATAIVRNMEKNNLVPNAGKLDVRYEVVNYVIYQEVIVTATREIPYPINLSIIGLPRTMTITVTSTAVVNDNEEFVRNLDLISDVVKYFGFDLKEIGKLFSSVRTVFGGK